MDGWKIIAIVISLVAVFYYQTYKINQKLSENLPRPVYDSQEFGEKGIL